jgi:MFS family permease
VTTRAELDQPAGIERRALQRRTLVVVVAAQVLSGAGLAAGVTVGALLAQDMLGSTGLAGLPAALFTGGSAAAALGVGRVSARLGRRPGLSLGYAVGALGGVGVVAAAVADNVPLLLVSFTVYGAGTATSLQARYAGADLAEPAARGRAVSTVLVATTAGAVAGPLLVDVTGRWAESVDIPRLAGPFALAALAYGVAGAVLFVLLRPDPLLTAHRLALAPSDPDVPPPPDEPAGSAATRVLALAATAMVLTQLVMVAVMTMTPVHLRAQDHELGAVGLVIAVHVAGMFLPSPLTGWLTDRYGRIPMLVAAALVLLAAGVVAAVSPPESVLLLAVALALLGLGWNFGIIAGTALVTDSVPLHRRARVQGGVDLGVALSGATGGIASGSVVAAASFPVLALVGGVLALAVLPLVVLARTRP